MKKYIESSIELNECYTTVDDLLKTMGFTYDPKTDYDVVTHRGDLIILSGSHQYFVFYCYNTDFSPEELFEIISDTDYDLFKISEQYNVEYDYYESLSAVLFNVFGY